MQSRLAAVLAAAFLPAAAGAQLVLPKTAPVAQGEQFNVFPSSRAAMGGVSIAVADTLLDPWGNPAKARRLRGTLLHGSPLFYDVSDQGGGGRTLPLGSTWGGARWTGGVIAALQQLERGREPWAPAERLSDRTATNHYLTGLAARDLGRGWAVGGSAFWGALSGVDGVELLYGGARRIDQRGHLADLRLGVVREWDEGRTLELVALHNRYDVTHDVVYQDWRWDPIARTPVQDDRTVHNQDRTLSWGLHAEFERPLAAPGWRIGWLGTANVHSHPKIPNYDFMSVPRDPGTTWAYNLGVGLARHAGPVTFGIDAIYEPMTSHTWADAERDTARVGGGTIRKGERTIENDFRFSNARLRLGVGREALLGEGQTRALGVQAGLNVHAINYHLAQRNHVRDTFRTQREDWIEWTPAWGVSVRFPDLEIQYAGRVTTGVGRPGIDMGPIMLAGDASLASSRGGGIIAAPSGALTLLGARVTTHQVRVALPVR